MDGTCKLRTIIMWPLLETGNFFSTYAVTFASLYMITLVVELELVEGIEDDALGLTPMGDVRPVRSVSVDKRSLRGWGVATMLHKGQPGLCANGPTPIIGEDMW